MVSQNVLNELFAAFPNAIMNRHLEFVAEPHGRVNSYFCLEDCETRMDATCKVLEYLSREAYKSMHFNAKWRNEEVHEYHLRGINDFCGTAFSYEDIELVYTYIGNGINREKTLDFIRSGYDITVLDERKNDGQK